MGPTLAASLASLRAGSLSAAVPRWAHPVASAGARAARRTPSEAVRNDATRGREPARPPCVVGMAQVYRPTRHGAMVSRWRLTPGFGRRVGGGAPGGNARWSWLTGGPAAGSWKTRLPRLPWQPR